MKFSKLGLYFSSVLLLAGCGGSNNTVEVKLYYTENDYFVQTAKIGQTERFEVKKKTGYQFNGYFSNDGTQYTDELGTTINKWSESNPTTLFGNYEPKVYTIEFDYDGGSSTSTQTYQITYDTDISNLNIPAPRKTGYTFIGFYTSKSGGNQITDENTNFVYDAKIFSSPYYPVNDYSTTIKFYARYVDKLVSVHLTGLNKTVKYRLGEKVYSFEYEIKINQCFVGYYYDSEFQKKIEYPLVIPDVNNTIVLYPKYQNGTEKGLSYSSDTDHSYIATYTGNDESIIVPDAYMGTPITKIGAFNAPNAKYIAIPQTATSYVDASFENCSNLEEFVGSNNITNLPKKCFNNCQKLTSLVIPYGVKEIGEEALYNCSSIKSLTISAGVETIGKNSLVKLTSLKDIKVDEDNTSYYAEDGVLYKKASNSSILVKYPDAKDGYSFDVSEKVNRINDYAFSYCSLRRITMVYSTTAIGEGAFIGSYCLTYVKVDGPNRLTIGKVAFAECPMLSTVILNVSAVASLSGTNVFDSSYTDFRIFVPSSVYSSYLTNSSWRQYASNLVRMSQIFGDYCIDDYGSGVKIIAYFGSDANVTIPNYINGKSVVAIGDNAFIFNEYLTSIELNEDLTLICNHAFQYCTNLETVFINGDSVKQIQGQPFEIGVNFFLRNNSSELLEEYKASWEIYQDYIWTAN